jgi:signal recognition particle receptor subunit beta
MAIIDPERNAVVIRIVYDGPPHAGKTTSVRSLARSLMREVETPLEAGGRTVYFDWMEYTGGLFEGHQIRCQIVSVPGQPDLAARRKALLETADVVVFVADTSTRDSVACSLEHVRQMVTVLRAHAELPIGVVVQANKRDVQGAIPRDEVRAALGDDFALTALTESVAQDGIGVRETFILAVRLALDRIRELIARAELPCGRPAIDTADQLLSMLEDEPVDSPPASDDIASAVMSLVAPPRPRLPDARVPSGAIWPPVEGRVVLHEATSAGLSVRRVGDGDWIAGLGSSWRVHSGAWAAFREFDDGRQALLSWARVHSALSGLLSPSRCVVLADAGADTWRLWQIVKLVPSLRAWLVDGAALPASELLGRLAAAAASLSEAYARCSDTRLLPTLDTIGRGVRGPQFVALMPAVSVAPPPQTANLSGQIARELSRLLGHDLAPRRADLARWIAHGQPARTPWDDVVTAAVLDQIPPRTVKAGSPG